MEDWDRLLKLLQREEYQTGVIASFGHMIPGKIIDAFPNGMLVMHPSLLPKYRGSCPIQYAILNQDAHTGVSIVECSKDKFDAGNILYRTSEPYVPISNVTRFTDLS